MAVDGDEEVAPGINAEEGSADGLVRDGQLDLPGPAPVAVDVVGQRREALLRDAPVQDAQGDEDFFVDVVRGGSKGKLLGQRGGDSREFGIGSGVVVQIEAEADDHAVGGELFHEDAANFFRSNENVVGPAQARGGQAESAQGGDNGEPGREGEGGPTAVGWVEGKDHGHPQAALT